MTISSDKRCSHQARMIFFLLCGFFHLTLHARQSRSERFVPDKALVHTLRRYS